MNIKRVIPSGYCKGVVRAILLAKQSRKQYPDKKIYIAGQIVHNHFVSDALNNLDIITLDNRLSKDEWIDTLNPGVMIFSAHGISQDIKNHAKDKGFIVVDASCEDVLKTQNLIRKKLEENYIILYIGKNKHPEAEAVLSLSTKVHLITSKKDIDNIDQQQKYFVTNQTTMSIFEIKYLFDYIKLKCPKAVFARELCHATTSHQEAVLALSDCDLLYVVGDPTSNNSNKLKEIALENGIKKVRMIEMASQIKEEDLIGANNVYVTAGASTPPYLSNQVLQTLKKYASSGILEKPEIDLSKIL